MPKFSAKQFSQNLRNLAAWYDKHPDAPVPDNKVYFSQHMIPTPENLAKVGKGVPDSSSTADLFYYRVEGDGFEVAFYCKRSANLEKAVVGQKTEDVVEWVLKTTEPVTETSAPEASVDSSN